MTRVKLVYWIFIHESPVPTPHVSSLAILIEFFGFSGRYKGNALMNH